MQTQKQNQHLGQDITLSHQNEKEEFEEICEDELSEESKEEQTITKQFNEQFIESDPISEVQIPTPSFKSGKQSEEESKEKQATSKDEIEKKK